MQRRNIFTTLIILYVRGWPYTQGVHVNLPASSGGESIQESLCPPSQLIVHVPPAVGALNVPESDPRAAPATGHDLVQAGQHYDDLVLFAQSWTLPLADVLSADTGRAITRLVNRVSAKWHLNPASVIERRLTRAVSYSQDLVQSSSAIRVPLSGSCTYHFQCSARVADGFVEVMGTDTAPPLRWLLD